MGAAGFTSHATGRHEREYGAIAGLITLEDCLEELVGDIIDEYDSEDPEVQRLPNGEFLVDGGVSIDEINDLLDIRLPDDDWDTLGGFVFSTLEHVPSAGECIESGGWTFKVTEMDGRRVRWVNISLAVDDSGEIPTGEIVTAAAARKGVGGRVGEESQIAER